MYKSIIRPILFQLNPESAHHFTFKFVRVIHRIPGVGAMLRSAFRVEDKSLEREVFGIVFPNPVGLAAGFDKDAKLYKELYNFGFGFIEIGTLTPVGQPGNPKPRMFRLPMDSGLINRMGFNNSGVDSAVERLKKRNPKLIIGGNIGKNKVTPNEEATSDYVKCFNALYDFVDYFVVNVSSPNTPNLRELQDKEPLTELLNTLEELNKTKPARKPILLKIAPDVTDGQLVDIVDIIRESGIDGVIATNTTIDRSGLITDAKYVESIGAGGLSGAPVKDKSTAVIKRLAELSRGSFPIIAVGGIYTAADAKEKLDAGASLVQVYTGFIYEGPGMVKRILKGL
ncbi:MAG: quinone-dependent dihydroorotate dehydrogenase [Bacteroidetes bacterium]|nr:MAG: quinone-dependent dihydroorotate dehydrogenase [Bacteroidota bacterium]